MLEEKLNLEMENDAELQMEYSEDQFHAVKRGQIIEAKVVLVRNDEVYVDIGGKADMVIPLNELTDQPIASAKELVKDGDLIQVMVVKAGGEDGVVLSKRRVDQAKVWEEFNSLYQSGAILEGKIIELVKGGLIVKINGINAFMPASKATLGFEADLSKLVGQAVQVKIIEFDRAQHKLVVSRRELLEAERKQVEDAFYKTISEGQRITGPVTRITNFGAFVDLGSGIEGLLHISELSWNRIKKVEDLLQVGQKVEAVIIKVDQANRKISLSLKQIEEHPWVKAVKGFKEGAVYQGEVTKLESFGAFIKLAPDLEGLAHISQLSERRISKPDEVVQVGDQVKVKLIKIDYDQRRVSLSLRQVAEDQEAQVKEEFLSQQDDQFFGQSLEGFFKEYNDKK